MHPFRRPDQQAFPIIKLGETDALELHFDDMQNSARTYYYTYVLCNADWTPANLSTMD
ncbi:MAG: type IX secretion system plug protein domain-containing protein, partial [Verrucomicrobiota bacterium]